jgi:hypothetical protein
MIKYLKFSWILFALFSCHGNQSEVNTVKLMYSIDSVIVNSKERILDLKHGIWISDLNENENLIFLFNSFDHSIDEINLDNLEVQNSFFFEPEGPNGTGNYINNLNLLKDGLLFIKSFDKSGLFTLNGILKNRVDWINSYDSNGLKYGEIPRSEIAVGSIDLKVFGLNYDDRNKDVFLDILSLNENSVKRYDIDTEGTYHKFVLMIDDPESFTFLNPIVYLRSENNLIIVSHQYSNELYLFSSEGEFLKNISYLPFLTPKRVKDPELKAISSIEIVKENYQNFLEQVRYGPPVWDNEKKRYFRLSAVRIFSDTRSNASSILPEISKVNVYISIFDSNFNLVSEVLVPELCDEFVKYFAKDGKLWVAQNFSDDLGFIVIDFENIR